MGQQSRDLALPLTEIVNLTTLTYTNGHSYYLTQIHLLNALQGTTGYSCSFLAKFLERGSIAIILLKVAQGAARLKFTLKLALVQTEIQRHFNNFNIMIVFILHQ